MPALCAALLCLACSDAGDTRFADEELAVRHFSATHPESLARLRKGMTQRELTDLLGRPHCWDSDVQNHLFWADGPDKYLWVNTNDGKVVRWEVQRLPYNRLTADKLAQEIRDYARKEWKPRE